MIDGRKLGDTLYDKNKIKTVHELLMAKRSEGVHYRSLKQRMVETLLGKELTFKNDFYAYLAKNLPGGGHANVKRFGARVRSSDRFGVGRQ